MIPTLQKPFQADALALALEAAAPRAGTRVENS
jgi:hypothetical protein